MADLGLRRLSSLLAVLVFPFMLYFTYQTFVTLTLSTFSSRFEAAKIRIPLEEDCAQSSLNRAVVLPIVGSFSNGKDYAIISASLGAELKHKYKYAFPLPLTVLAWRRVGFRCIVILVGTKDSWISKSGGKLIYDKLIELEAIVVFMEASEKSQTMISQVSRVFVPAILGMDTRITNDTYVITSDADLFPVNKQLYKLTNNSDILSLNSDCCRPFNHKGKNYKMLPMANIGMKVNMWADLVSSHNPMGSVPVKSEEMRQYLHAEFGNVTDAKVTKGENLGWYLDQRLISILVKSDKPKETVSIMYQKRHTGQDRIDRSRWNPTSLKGINDSHILEYCYRSSTWQRMSPLLKLMFQPAEVEWCNSYQTNFLKEARVEGLKELI